MKEIIIVILLVIGSLGFTGCASVSVSNPKVQNAKSVKNIVVKGASKKNIREEFGSPSEIKYESHGKETWIYTSQETFNPINLLGIYNLDVTELNILFSKTGKVLKHTTTKSERKI
jgi:outer membrane protein assembly factor BamE (lipoprotein component of BamABCDE complex)